MLTDLTIYIPIRDRTCCIKRLVKYYEDLYCKKIFVDSTNTRYTADNNIGTFEYHHIGPYNYYHKIHMIQHTMVTTPFVLDICDDDIVLKNSIIASIEFLKNNPNYSLCDGEYVDLDENFQFNQRNQDAYLAYTKSKLISPIPARRLRFAFKHYVARNHAIIRTDVSRLIFKTFVENTCLQPIKFCDRVFTAIAAIKGNFKTLPILYQVRTNKGRISHRPHIRRELQYGIRIINHLDNLKPVSELLASEAPFSRDPHKYLTNIVRRALKFRGNKHISTNNRYDNETQELIQIIKELG